MALVFPLKKSKLYLPNPIARYGIPQHADSSINPKAIGTQAYNEFWNEQLYYIHNGYETGGIHIPGRYYYFLNFVRLPSVRGIMYPEILDYQLEFFLLVEQAKLERKSIIIPKARRKGLSVMMSTVIDHGWRFTADYKSGVSAGLREYVNEFMSKWQNINRNVCDEFKVNIVSNDEDEVIAGWKEKDSYAGFIQKGTSNSIIQKTMFHNANLFKGYYLNDCVFEEGGEFNKLIETYNATRACFMDGSIQRGTGYIYGCVCAGTKVWDNKGNLINIEDLKQEDGILGFSGTGISKEPITWIKPPAQKPCYRITMSSNNVIECSEDHPLMWSSRNWKLRKARCTTFKRANEVKVGDQLMLIDKVELFGNKKMWMPRFIGLMIGDGNCSNGVSFGTCEEELKKYIEQNFDYTITRIKTTKKGLKYNEYSIKGVIPNLREIGIHKLTKQEKRLPKNISQYDKKSIAELIGGYFDADGNIKYTKKEGLRICLTSVVKELLEEVKFQLIKFGIDSNICRENRNNDSGYGTSDHIYRLYIAKYKSVLRFAENISFLCKHKQDVLDKAFKIKRVTRMSQEKYSFNINKENMKGESYLDMEYISGLRHETVKKVEFIGMQYVYNLTAGLTHTYIANGFVTGNTGGNMKKGSKDLRELWHDYETHNLLRFFVSAQKFYAPFYSGYSDDNGKLAENVPNLKKKYKDYERVGMDDDEAALTFIKAEKARLQKNRNKKSYFEYCQNNPTDIKEVFLESNVNNFDVEVLNDQMHSILSEETKYLKYKLEYKKKEDGTFISPRQVVAIPIADGEDDSETIMILNGYGPATAYKYLDIGGIDGYDQDQAQTSNTLGAMVIIRRQNTTDSESEGMLPIAVIWTRPKRREMFYDLCLKASIYFNLVDSVLFDVRSPMVSKHFEENEGWKFLADRPKKFETENSQQTHVKGVSLNAYSKPVMLSLLQSFFLDHGKKIWFPCIVDEALRYDTVSKESDCDSVDALGIALMCLINMGYGVIDENDTQRDKAFDFPQWTVDADGNWRDSSANSFDIRKYVSDPDILNNDGLLREAEFYLKNSKSL